MKRIQFTVVGGRRLVCVDGSPWLPITKEMDAVLRPLERLLDEARQLKAKEQSEIAVQRDRDMAEVREKKREAAAAERRGRVASRLAAIKVAEDWTAARRR